MATLGNFKLGLCTIAVMMIFSPLLMGLSVEGVPVSIQNVLSPSSQLLTVHCTKDNQDMGSRVINPFQIYSFSVPRDYFGPWVCNFAAAGKRTTTMDVYNSRCNCNTYNGCEWVVKNDGFYCNHDYIRRWD